MKNLKDFASSSFYSDSGNTTVSRIPSATTHRDIAEVYLDILYEFMKQNNFNYSGATVTKMNAIFSAIKTSARKNIHITPTGLQMLYTYLGYIQIYGKENGSIDVKKWVDNVSLVQIGRK